MDSVLVLAGLIVLLAAGIPVGFALGGLGLIMLVVSGFSPLIVPQSLLSTVDSFVLLAVPLFLLMSHVLLQGGVGRDLFAAVQSWVGHWPGGLAVATILSCGLFAAISGSSVATAATIGNVAIPEMLARGYDRRFVLGLLAAGGTLGILIPPSIPMIIYGFVTDESVLKLFLAGIGPGIFLVVLFVALSMLFARFGGGYRQMARASREERRRSSVRALPSIGLVATIILGIYAGAFTPTEAAGVGLAGALVITGPLLRTLTWTRLKKAVADSMVTTASILIIVAGAKVFGKALALYRIPQDISALIADNIQGAGLFVLAVSALLIVMGLFLEALSMLLIMVPLLSQSLLPLGIDPIWFGVFFVIMIECALITPPMGINLYVIQAVGHAKLGDVAVGVWPFLLLMLTTVLGIYLIPDIVLFIPFND